MSAFMKAGKASGSVKSFEELLTLCRGINSL